MGVTFQMKVRGDISEHVAPGLGLMARRSQRKKILGEKHQAAGTAQRCSSGRSERGLFWQQEEAGGAAMWTQCWRCDSRGRQGSDGAGPCCLRRGKETRSHFKAPGRQRQLFKQEALS